MLLGYLLLLVAIGFENLGTAALKGSDGFRKPALSFLAIGGYGISFFAMGQALNRLPLALAYAVWSGLGIILVTVLGVVLYRELFNRRIALGLLLIIAGIVLANWTMDSTAPGIALTCLPVAGRC